MAKFAFFIANHMICVIVEGRQPNRDWLSINTSSIQVMRVSKNDKEANLPGRATSTIKLISTSRFELSQWMDRGVVPQNRDNDKEVGTTLPGRTTSTNKLISTSRCELSQWMGRGVVPQPGQRQRGWDEKRVKADARKSETKYVWRIFLSSSDHSAFSVYACTKKT